MTCPERKADLTILQFRFQLHPAQSGTILSLAQLLFLAVITTNVTFVYSPVIFLILSDDIFME
jgi:hypothetical protein